MVKLKLGADPTFRKLDIRKDTVEKDNHCMVTD